MHQDEIVKCKLKFYDDLVDFMYYTIVIFDLDYEYTKEAFHLFSTDYTFPIADVTIDFSNWESRALWIKKLEKLYQEIESNNDLLINSKALLREEIFNIIERNKTNRFL